MLQRTMNVYRASWWQRHNRVNREWVANLLPSVQRFENDIAPRLAGAYGGAWPDPWTRVDVMPYANRVGGYTTGHPHITVSSVDEGNTDYLGLELLFHEASHGDTLERPLRRLVNESFEATGGRRPADLWHMTIFLTAGEMTRSVLEAAGEGDYTPYAEFAGIWGRRPDNTKSEELLREHWLPALQAGSGYRAARCGASRRRGPPERLDEPVTNNLGFVVQPRPVYEVAERSAPVGNGDHAGEQVLAVGREHIARAIDLWRLRVRREGRVERRIEGKHIDVAVPVDLEIRDGLHSIGPLEVGFLYLGEGTVREAGHHIFDVLVGYLVARPGRPATTNAAVCTHVPDTPRWSSGRRCRPVRLRSALSRSG